LGEGVNKTLSVGVGDRVGPGDEAAAELGVISTIGCSTELHETHIASIAIMQNAHTILFNIRSTFILQFFKL
jgi:hypothetical protein